MYEYIYTMYTCMHTHTHTHTRTHTHEGGDVATTDTGPHGASLKKEGGGGLGGGRWNITPSHGTLVTAPTPLPALPSTLSHTSSLHSLRAPLPCELPGLR